MINFENLSPDMQSAIVSGLIGLLGAIIGALAAIASTWVAKKLQTTGKVSLFVKIDSCWIVKQIPMEKQWIALNKRCRYGNYRETL